MENDKLIEKINYSNEDYDVNKKVIRFSIVNKESGNVFSNFYNFDNEIEIAEFLKKFIIPSSIASVVTEDNGDIIVLLEDLNAMYECLDDDIQVKLKDVERRLDKISMVKDEEKEIKKIIAIINEVFLFASFTLVSVEYAKNTSDYLNNLYGEYKGLNELDMLEKELARIEISMEDFKMLCKNTNDYSQNIKDLLLDKLPY